MDRSHLGRTFDPAQESAIRISEMLMEEVGEERRAEVLPDLHRAHPPHDPEEFKFRMEFDVLDSSIKHYATGLGRRGWIAGDRDEVAAELRSLNLLRRERMHALYRSTQDAFPRVRHYMNSLDLLRLLVLEHIERFPDSVSPVAS